MNSQEDTEIQELLKNIDEATEKDEATSIDNDTAIDNEINLLDIENESKDDDECENDC